MKSVSSLFTQPRNLLVLLHDTAMAFFAVATAFFLRIGLATFEQFETVVEQAVIYAALAFFVYLFTGLYRHVWAYVSFTDGVNILRSATAVALLFLPLMFLVTRLDAVPRSVPIISWFVLAAFLSAPRLACRFIKDKRFGFLGNADSSKEPILLVGSGDEAAHFIRATQQEHESSFRVVGLVTAIPGRVGQIIHGIEVLGLENEVESIIIGLTARGFKPKRLVLARQQNKADTVRELLKIAQSTGCILSRLPPAADVRAYNEAEFSPQPIQLEDLLGRPPKSLNRDAMHLMIKGRRVLVTGAGGSIGSELVRQIATGDPDSLCLLDQGEFNLYAIEREVHERWPGLKARPVLADVRDYARIQNVFEAEKPDIVFHAAALKHVPMVECNPIEGLATNALGTRVIADACLAQGVPEMVLISSDKAVNPANVMGAGKRLAEIYCQAVDVAHPSTRFITVRFGNVLGSAGSVVPLFQKQISEGGPLTVTHPDIERFFMTVGEAVELVLQAAALGPSRNDEGAIYVLDMGSPVKIIDLARQVIRLAGKIPDEDINIEITGLRPGEKLYEELFHGQEPPVGTGMDGILIATPRTATLDAITAQLDKLAVACRQQDETKALKIVASLVPEMIRPKISASVSEHAETSSPMTRLKIVK